MNKNIITKYARKSLTLKRLYRWYYARKAHFDWQRILTNEREIWNTAVDESKKGPNILVATSVGFIVPSITMETLLAVALILRGANVHVLLCDSVLPACMACEIGWYPDQERFLKKRLTGPICQSCFKPAYRKFNSLGVRVHRFSDFLTEPDFNNAGKISSEISLEDIGNYTYENCSVGEYAMAGALRFFARGDLGDEPFGEKVLRRYFEASLISFFAMRNLLKKHIYQAAVFNHGIYVPQGIIGEICRKKKVRVVNWNPAYRKKCFIFSHNDSYHHTMIDEPVEKWKNISWDTHLETDLFDYLKSRWRGTQDWIWFHEKPDEEIDVILQKMNIDTSKPIIGMLSNVIWDAQLHYKSNAFSNMLDWVLQTIEYFKRRQDLQLILRIHPAEVRGMIPSRQPLLQEIVRVFPVLPSNVCIIPSESNISTYAVMMKCDSVIIYGTKTGVELTAMGIPVIVAGEAWIRNKGFAFSADSAESYFRILDRLPFNGEMSKKNTEDAMKYAYHFFFRRMIPLECMVSLNGWPLFKNHLTRLQEIMPNSSKGLDIICDGIMHGTDFIYPAERIIVNGKNK